MKARVNSISLEGTSRSIDFQSGLNIITGPIASGKTSLIRLMRFLIGASLKAIPPEVRSSVIAVSGDILLGEEAFSIVKPLTSTTTTKVDIAGEKESLRLPVTSTGAEQTYLRWLLDKLNLPRLDVPSAPTKPESEPTPVSINDYMLYCYLSQAELGFSVFGHHDPFKNIKRKYVFQIVYGIYSLEMATLQEELRDVQIKLRGLRNRDELFAAFLEDTAFSNKAELEKQRQLATAEIAELEQRANDLSVLSQEQLSTANLRAQALKMERELEELKAEYDAEIQSIESLRELSNQLEAQSGKITRSIVAHKHLTDIEFYICPRCGASVSTDRISTDKSEEELCYLCKQSPKIEYSRDSMIKEQSRIEAQLAEAQTLLDERIHRSGLLKDSLSKKRQQLSDLQRELAFQTKSFVSSHASEISEISARRATLQSNIEKIKEYLNVLNKFDESRRWISELFDKKNEIQSKMDLASVQEEKVQTRITSLANNYNAILEQFEVPQFGEEKTSTIDQRTYLPIFHGRRFDDLISPGLCTLVNVAHAFAHQISAIQQQLMIPNILMIDGLSEHLGEEGLDPKRLRSIYDFLIETSNDLGDQLQIIVVDSEIPENARRYIRLELSDQDRLIPLNSLR